MGDGSSRSRRSAIHTSCFRRSGKHSCFRPSLCEPWCPPMSASRLSPYPHYLLPASLHRGTILRRTPTVGGGKRDGPTGDNTPTPTRSMAVDDVGRVPGV